VSEQQPIRLVILSANFETLVEDTAGILHDYLAARIPVEQRLVQWPSDGGQVDLTPLDEADVALVFADRAPVPAAGLEQLQAYCAAERPLVAVRCNGMSLDGWTSFEREVLSAEVGARGAHGTSYAVDFGAPRRDHPLVEGMEPFEAFGSPLTDLRLADGADATQMEVVAEARLDDGRVPVAWTRQCCGARVFATTLGHPRDFWEYDFLRLVENAVLWAAP